MENIPEPTDQHNVILILLPKFIRMFSFGTLSVPIIIYLQQIGLNPHQIGILMTIVLIGNFVINWIFTSRADKIGRKRSLIFSAFLKFVTGVLFMSYKNYYVLCVVGAIGIISIAGGETGPFFPIQQAILSDIVQARFKKSEEPNKVDSQISKMMGWYNFVGFAGFALGCGCISFFIKMLKQNGFSQFGAHQLVMFGYSIWGLVILILYLFLNSEVQAIPQTQIQLLIPQQKSKCSISMLPSILGFDSLSTLKLISILGIFMIIDSFAGYLTPNSFYSVWYKKQWNISTQYIGLILMICSIASGIGGFIASLLVQHIGIVAIMIGSHIPSNFFIIMIPLMPSKQLSIVMCVLKSFTSNMNLSSRQTYIMSLVKSDEKSAANGIMTMTRTLGSIFSPLPLSSMMGANVHSVKFSLPFYLNGSIRFVLDFFLLMFYMITQKRRTRNLIVKEGLDQECNHNQNVQLIPEVMSQRKTEM